MKKLLAGCLVVVVLGVIVFGVGAYMLYRAATPLIEDARGYIESMSQLTELEKGIENRSAFTAPASGELVDEQVQRFARVQTHVLDALGQRVKEFEEKYKHLSSDGNNAQVGFTELLSGLRDLSNVYLDARRYQIDALNRERFSQDEYSWVRDRMLQAAGMELTGHVDLQKLGEAVRSGTGLENITIDQMPRLEVPAKNRELVKPFLDSMDDWLPLLFFGL